MVLLLTIGDLHIPIRTHDLPNKFKKLLVPGKIGQIVCTGNVCDRETWEYLRSISSDVRGVRGDFDETPNLPPSLTLQHGSLKIGVIHGHQIVPLGDTESLAAAARKLDVDVLVTGATHRFEAFEFESKFFINPGSATGAFTPTWPISPPHKSSSTNPSSLKSPQNSTTTPTHPSTKSPNGSTTSPTQSTRSLTHQNSSTDQSKSPTNPNAQLDQPSTEPNENSRNVPPEDHSSSQDQKPIDDPDSLYPPGPIPSFALLDIQGSVVVTYVYRLVDGEVKVEKIEYRKEIPISSKDS
ncbi:Vacuolar protein sorting-associated protein 29 [Puccinia graminis f. sp. tritici]|uniref:Vacuolar protein sorting-associated protein 29 n=1 Tax=Puccinia graminis f. sp. tritici TaxID=56615 RepID=A0A5B0NCU9_PUCGR|nr:Vacuolar protein sorting-associated protein 29 [Puccinia graminis f. sp. tritici]